MPNFIVFRPNYVKKFKCDGKLCNAYCCYNWRIDIDKNTYKEYSEIEKSKGDITDKFQYVDERKGYIVKLNEKKACPFLRDDKLCGIQKKYGEKFLSMVCYTFPRHITAVGDICEVSLSLACPVAAELILKPSEAMDFEWATMSDDSKIGKKKTNFDAQSVPQVLNVQTAAISILQERTLTIDQRLAVLGLFLDGFEEILSADSLKFHELINVFTSTNFITTQAINLLRDVDFKPKNFIRMLLSGVLENLSEDKSEIYTYEVVLLYALKKILKIKSDENGTISINAAAENFVALTEQRRKFCKRFGKILENYLVQDFFKNFYPWSVEKSIRHNYGLFVAIYKLVEFFLFALYQNNPSFDENNMIKFISLITRDIDHTKPYVEKISAELEGNDDTFKIISTFLQI